MDITPVICSSATIEIFARLQQHALTGKAYVGSATIEIFARLQPKVNC